MGPWKSMCMVERNVWSLLLGVVPSFLLIFLALEQISHNFSNTLACCLAGRVIPEFSSFASLPISPIFKCPSRKWTTSGCESPSTWLSKAFSCEVLCGMNISWCIRFDPSARGTACLCPACLKHSCLCGECLFVKFTRTPSSTREMSLISLHVRLGTSNTLCRVILTQLPLVFWTSSGTSPFPTISICLPLAAVLMAPE